MSDDNVATQSTKEKCNKKKKTQTIKYVSIKDNNNWSYNIYICYVSHPWQICWVLAG